MCSYQNNQEFYDHIDRICAELRRLGFSVIADRIEFLLHTVAWTTATELFGELELVIQSLLQGEEASRLTPELRKSLDESQRVLRDALDRRG